MLFPRANLRTLAPVDAKDPYDVLLWSFVMGVPVAEMLAAIERVGTNVEDVFDAIGRQAAGGESEFYKLVRIRQQDRVAD